MKNSESQAPVQRTQRLRIFSRSAQSVVLSNQYIPVYISLYRRSRRQRLQRAELPS